MIEVDTQIPAGNGIIHRVEGGRIYLSPDNRDSTRDWFYWHVRIRNCAGRNITLLFDRPCCTTVRGAAVSRDQGRTWAWVPEYVPYFEEVHIDAGDADELQVCLAFPYTLASLDTFLKQIPETAPVRRHELCRTRKDRAVPWLELGAPKGREQTQWVFTARHHACEMMANYVLEGILTEFLDTLSLHGTHRLLVVPLVDLDGVEDGDQGKDRAPRDHNRDYDPPAVHPETAAVRAWIEAETDDQLAACLDLHCPFVTGAAHNQKLYFVGSESKAVWEKQQELARRIEKQNRSPLPFSADDAIPFGQGWNTADNYKQGLSFIRWMIQTRPACLSTTLEIPYADVKEETVTPDHARAFGHELARALFS
jgi:hypothetical protein